MVLFRRRLAVLMLGLSLGVDLLARQQAPVPDAGRGAAVDRHPGEAAAGLAGPVVFDEVISRPLTSQ